MSHAERPCRCPECDAWVVGRLEALGPILLERPRPGVGFGLPGDRPPSEPPPSACGVHRSPR